MKLKFPHFYIFWRLLAQIHAVFQAFALRSAYIPDTNFEQETPNLAKIGCFLPSLAQNTPNLCKLGAFICDETPRSLYPNPQKSTQKADTYTYTMSMWVPASPGFHTFSCCDVNAIFTMICFHSDNYASL